MLTEASGASVRVSWRLRMALVAGALAVLALPLVTLSRAPVAAAQEGQGAPTVTRAREKAPATEFFPPPSASDERILAELDKPTTMDFVETPLGDVVEYLRDLHGIPIQFDVKALAENGVDDATPIDRQLKDITLRSALRLMLGKLELAHVIDNEVLLITTIDRAQGPEGIFTRTYPVGDLVDGADLAAYHKLGEAITTAVRPDTWDASGGPGSLAPVLKSKSLVISQTRDGHDEVLRLLRSLRSAGGKP